MIKVLITPAVVSLATILLAFGNNAAFADTVECGDEIFVDTRLDADIDCSAYPGRDGIMVGAPGITINLNGFTIMGPPEEEASGIFNVGWDGVTIKNGAISGFQDGVRADGVNDLVIKDVMFSNQGQSSIVVINSAEVRIKRVFISQPHGYGAGTAEAIRLAGVDDARVKNATVDGGFFGVLAQGDPILGGSDTATEIVVKNSVFTNTVNGIRLVRILDSRIVGNEVSDSSEVGIGLIDYSTGNKIKLNAVVGSGVYDLSHDGQSSPNKWIDNTCGTSSGADIDCP